MTDKGILKMDQVWRPSQYTSFAIFHESIGDLFLRPQVPVAIRRQLSIVHKLLQHSYFEYGFLDVALARALQVFEMAIKTRYAEIEGKPPKRSFKLKNLIDWTGSKGLLEQSLDMTQLFRQIRNSVAHGSPETIMGVTALQMTQSVVDFVNELYEDIEERARRHIADLAIGQRLSDAVQDGAIVTIYGKKLIIFHALVACSIIEQNRVLTYVAYFPIFDAREVDGSMQTPQAIFGKSSDSKIVGNSFRLSDGDDSLIVVEPIQDETNRRRYESFKNEYNKHDVLSMVIHTQVADYRRNVRRCAIRSNAIGINRDE